MRKVINAVVGVAAGGVDEAMEYLDERQGRLEPFKGWTDWTRVGLTLLGYLGQGFNFFTPVTVPMAQSEVTLLTKSVGRLVRQQVGGGAGTMVSRRRVARPISRRIRETPGPGFEELQTY